MALREAVIDSNIAALTESERALGQQVAVRLRAEFLNLVAALPDSARTALGMARAIGVSRTICHRLLSALQERAEDLRFLTMLPGVEGLRQCVARLREQFPELDETLVAAADAAIDSFHDLIRRASGSHSRLCARIRATQDARDAARPVTWPSRRLALRREMHAVAVALSGRSMGARTSLSIMRPIPDRPNEFEYVHVRACVRQRTNPGAVAWVVASSLVQAEGPDNSGPAVEYRALDGSPLLRRSALPLIPSFCGQPLPIVTPRDGAGKLIRIVDAQDSGAASAGYIPDVVLAYRLPTLGLHHTRQNPPVHCEGVAVQDAIERMVFDVYLHRSMAAMVAPSMNLYFGRRDVDCDLTDRWFDRLEGSPLLTLLGPGLGNAHTGAWDRHAELTKYVFDTVGWPAEEFVGYRCDEAYPLWGCDYVMAFEYDRATQPQPA